MLPGRLAPALLGVVLTQCFPPGDGLSPPREQIYFPVGLAVDAESQSLFVVNSDFDLQYNQGVLQRYDLERLHQLVPKPCNTDGDCPGDQRCDTEPTAENSQRPSHYCVDNSGEYRGLPCGPLAEANVSDRWIAPGRCGPISAGRPQDGGGRFITSSVEIGAFATDVVYRRRPDDAPDGPPGRLFAPVRGDTTLHYVDVESNGALECGQRSAEGRCSDAHRVGDDPDAENTRDLRLPVEPFGIAASSDGRVLTVTHQTQGQVSLFINDWGSAPRLEFVLGGLPSRPMEIAALPVPALVPASGINYQPGFLVTFRSASEVRLMRFFDDGLFSSAVSSPARPYLADVGSGNISTNSLGVDSRGIAVDFSARDAAEAECAALSDDAERISCLTNASAIPLDVFVANRTPPSLVLGRTRPEPGLTLNSDLPVFYGNVPLTAGPSRVFVAPIINRDGGSESRVFVVCFDSRLIFIYDPVADSIEAEVFTGRGPHAMAFDIERGVAYVGHFTDSYIGVIGLDQRFPRSYGSIIASIGTPTAPRATK